MNKPLASLAPASAAKARFTKAEFLTMAATGAFDDMKIELVDGELERINPPMSEHGFHQAAVSYALQRVMEDEHELRVAVEVGIEVTDDSVFACDIAVVRGRPSTNRLLQPDELVLVVEISHTSLDRDMSQKRIAYAVSAIPHYWVVDSERRVVHVFGDPVRGDYAEVSTVRFGAPLAVPGTDRTIVLES